MAAYIVNLAYSPLVNDQVNGLAVILHIKPVADIFAGSIHRERLIIEGVDDH